MSILELYQADGLQPKRAASTGGGEYCGPCPWCGGADRFRLWPLQGDAGKYWCRGCGRGGDAIQYLRERRGLSYQEALAHLGLNPLPASCREAAARPSWEPRECATPGELWQAQARSLVDEAVKTLWGPAGQAARRFLAEKRGLTPATIKAAALGWIPNDRWCDAGEWGLPAILKDNGQPKKFWIPQGLTIPMMQGGNVVRIRVRRPEGEPRYYVLRGSSMVGLMITGEAPALVVVESELDGLLLHQEAGDLVGLVALGNAQSRPDREAAALLSRARLILVGLDADRAGAREAWGWWADHYSQARRWPPIEGKDLTEMHLAGVSLKLWTVAGLREHGLD